MRLITLDFPLAGGTSGIVRGNYVQTVIITPFSLGIIVSPTKTYIKDSITNATNSIISDRIRELAGSTESCVSSSFSLSNIDFSIDSGTIFTPGGLTFEGSPIFDFQVVTRI